MEYRASEIQEMMPKKPSTFELMQDQIVILAKGGYRVLHYAMYFFEEEAVSLQERFTALGFEAHVGISDFGDEQVANRLISIRW